ncbi:MAG: aldose 1-epimerase [Maribacter sp.]|jgi:aldose 1-epimerase
MRSLNNKGVLLGIFGVVLLCFSNCKENKQTLKQNNTVIPEATFNSNLLDSSFDTIIEGKAVKLCWLKTPNLKLAITNYGGRLVGLWTRDKSGQFTDVVIGRGSTRAYIEGPESYFGATIGRVGNRIAKGKFTINEKEYTIIPNNNENALHGGEHGFQDKVWNAQQPNGHTLILSYTSPDMEEGFPGTLMAKVTYTLTENNSLLMQYEATTNKPTIVNLTNHAYFNLNGEGSGSILNHQLQIHAEKFTPVDTHLIPTGELRNIADTPFDFSKPHAIGDRIKMDNEQLTFGGGYDHNFVVNSKKLNEMKHAARVVGDKSGIVMDVFTKEPGIQFYSGNFMNSENRLKSGAKDDFRSAFCLETQHFPDAPNQLNFPTILLNPFETYHTVSEYAFSIL